MPTNASPHYAKAEAEYLQAETTEQKIRALKKMISLAPQHKGAENLRAQLKRRLAKLKYTKEKESKKASGGKPGIKKADLQAVLVGLTNSGKSSILSLITNKKPQISSYPYTTKNPEIGTLNFEHVNIQIIDLPAIESEYTDQGIINMADTLLITITNLSDLEKINPFLEIASNQRLIIFNKTDLLTENEKRKISSTLSSKKLNHILISCKQKQGIEELKQKIFNSFNIIRVYTKQPHKEPDNKPVILKTESTVEDVARKISKELLNSIKQIKIWGPSSKFPGQVVGLKHILKDKDIVEFHTR
jgi:hypothetical protein